MIDCRLNFFPVADYESLFDAAIERIKHKLREDATVGKLLDRYPYPIS